MTLDSLINELSDMQAQARAYQQVRGAAIEAHEYCHKYFPSMIGANIWTLVINDAIRLREKYELKTNTESTKDN